MAWESAERTGAARYTVAAITYIVAFGPQAPSTPPRRALSLWVRPWTGVWGHGKEQS